MPCCRRRWRDAHRACISPSRLIAVGLTLADLLGQNAEASVEKQHDDTETTEPLQALGLEATPQIQEMLVWLEAHGATWMPGLRVRSLSPVERGLVATHELTPNRHGLLDVPTSLTLSADACLQNTSSIANKIPAHLRDGLSRSHGLLHLCFLEHYLLLGKTSFYAPYLNSLPASLSHLPLLSTLDLSSLLDGSQLLQDIEKHRRDLESLYEEIAWDIPEFRSLVSLSNFMLTYCMVESHSHARHMGNDTKPLMVPLVDLINHNSLHPSLRLGWAGPEHLHVNVGKHSVSAGEQLFFRYSDEDESSAKFFKQFGFVDENLPVGVKIQFPLRQHHPGYTEKRAMFDDALVRTKMMILEQMQDGLGGSEYLEQKVYDFPKFCIWLCGPEASGFKNLHPKIVDEELLPFARFVVFRGTNDSLASRCEVQHKPPRCNAALSTEEEVAAGQFLLDSITEHLGKYPTSVSFDDEELTRLSASAPEKPYVRIRRDEKHCLGSLEAAVKAIFPTLNGVAPKVKPVTHSGSAAGLSQAAELPAPLASTKLPGLDLAFVGVVAGIATLLMCRLVIRLAQPKAAHTD